MDLFNKEDLKKAMTREEICHTLRNIWSSEIMGIEYVAINAACDELKSGNWITPSRNPEIVNKELFCDCSVCGFTTMDETNFCPHCGAKMGEEK